MTPEEKAGQIIRAYIGPLVMLASRKHKMRNDIAAAIRAAVADETEACGKVAEQVAAQSKGYYSPTLTGSDIAAAVRQRSKQ